ncbi:MAG TPA: hypothetical protein VN047_03115 [Sphingopyxis sp.]|uniref:hypothetical protein n=1 Tax=Sphingopyxis sp. TaxID=1908224 RepID=UPI002CCF99BB|nr:hypothetical protein [Sphingopyxis sp.]HWW55862.1 hypothetical protein [Sphingopyxis sp.]
MTVRREGQTVFLEGRCTAEDAETLLVALRDEPGAEVDASAVTRLHLAVAQILLALRPHICSMPQNPILADVIAPR